MTREALADRLVNYADAAAAFSVVNSLTFIVTLTETEIRCSLADLHSFVVSGQIVFSILIVLVVVMLRAFETKVRSAAPSLDPDVGTFLRGFFIARLVVIAFATTFTVYAANMALSDTSCVPPASNSAKTSTLETPSGYAELAAFRPKSAAG